MVPVGVPVPVLKIPGGFSVNHQVALRILIQAADDIQHGCFPAARRAEDGDEFVLPKLKVDPLERVDDTAAGGIVLLDIDQL